MGFWEPLFFWIFAAGALISSIAVLSFRNPLYSALSLVGDFFCFAGLYVLLSAHFMAVTQVLVYGGAIMVLFLFIIMLLNLNDDDLGARRFSLHHVLAVLTAIAVFVFAASSILAVVDLDEVADGVAAQKQANLADQPSEATSGDAQAEPEPVQPAIEVPSAIPGLAAYTNEAALTKTYAAHVDALGTAEATGAAGKYPRFDDTAPAEVPPLFAPAEPTAGADGRPVASRRADAQDPGSLFGTVEPISLLLVNRFVVPFELTAVLLLAAIIGAVIIAKKRL